MLRLALTYLKDKQDLVVNRNLQKLVMDLFKDLDKVLEDGSITPDTITCVIEVLLLPISNDQALLQNIYQALWHISASNWEVVHA